MLVSAESGDVRAELHVLAVKLDAVLGRVGGGVIAIGAKKDRS